MEVPKTPGMYRIAQPSTKLVPLDSGVLAEMPYHEKKAFKGPFGLGRGGTVCLYILFTLLLIIGIGGFTVSLLFYLLPYPTNVTDSLTTTWKIIGIAIGGFIMVAAFVLFVIFCCDHCSHAECMPGLRRKRKVGNSNGSIPVGFGGPQTNLTGLYRINEGEEVKNDLINREANRIVYKNVVTAKRPGRFDRRRKNRVSSAASDAILSDYDPYDDDENYIPRYHTPHTHRMPPPYPYSHTPYPPMMPMQMPIYDPNYNPYNPYGAPPAAGPLALPAPPAKDASTTDPRPQTTTIIKEIHHHHYGAPPESAKKQKSASIRSMSRIEKQNSNVSTFRPEPQNVNEVQTYKVNSQTGQLELQNQNPPQQLMLPAPPMQPQQQQPIILTQGPPMIPQNAANKWILVKNNIPKLMNANQQPVILKPVVVVPQDPNMS